MSLYTPPWRLDYQAKQVHEYDRNHEAYMFYATFLQLSKAEIRDMERQNKEYDKMAHLL